MKLLLTSMLLLLIIGCSSNAPIAPREVVLQYADTIVPAKIGGGGAFLASKDTELETVVFSGNVSEQGERYRVDVAFSRQIKSSDYQTDLKTTIVLGLNEPATIGGVNSAVYSISLE
ncbi:MAG: hypothetical protein AAGG55_17010 [Pseudomonadota bacterium]